MHSTLIPLSLRRDAYGQLEAGHMLTIQVYAHVPNSRAVDVDCAVKAAQDAFPAWSSLSRAKRSAIMMRVAEILEARLDGAF
jgi:acyl-CoA reductase-like NAD-dependent aldehyde dehydrogenase